MQKMKYLRYMSSNSLYQLKHWSEQIICHLPISLNVLISFAHLILLLKLATWCNTAYLFIYFYPNQKFMKFST